LQAAELAKKAGTQLARAARVLATQFSNQFNALIEGLYKRIFSE
jgi:hypothetical protein